MDNKIAGLERTLIILKPDAVKRNLVGRLISRFEDKGMKIIKCELMLLNEETVKIHYEEHLGKDFYEELIKFMMSGPVMVMCVSGLNAISVCRKMIGSSGCPGTIRGDFCHYASYNLVHGSDSPISAYREIALFFPDLDDVSNYERPNDVLFYGY